jgi:PAS domain S-box-containing protein
MNMETERIKVLYVDDEEGNLMAFRASFRRDFDIHVAVSGAEALAFLEQNTVHVVISDQRMPGMPGAEFLAIVKVRWPRTVRLLLTGFSDIQAVVDAINLGGIHAYITKPWDPTDLKLRIEQAHEVHMLREERERLFDRYRQVFDASGDPIIILDHSGRIREINAAALALVRIDKGSLLTSNAMGLLADKRALVPGLRAGRKGMTFTNVETELHTPDGRMIDCLITATYLGSSPEGPSLYQAMIKDISDRKHEELRLKKLNSDLDKRVAVRTRQLMEALDDLSAFSYSVAHDLRSPLKNIKTLSNHLGSLLALSGNEEEKDLSQRIHKGSARLISLVDDLLRFARTDSQKIEREDIDLADIVKECLNNIAMDHEHVQFEFPKAHEVNVHADRSMLKVVMNNLLANAIKFTRDRKPARVEVGHHSDGEGTVIWVKDNGVGFENSKKDLVFGVFKRLHSANQFEGTGIGLALVDRIMKKHSGNCWADGALDQGATFFLRFPRGSEHDGIRLAS